MEIVLTLKRVFALVEITGETSAQQLTCPIYIYRRIELYTVSCIGQSNAILNDGQVLAHVQQFQEEVG